MRGEPRARGAGRHYLVPHAARELAGRAELTSADTVVEIGAGFGALTTELAGRAGRVVAVEIDRDLAGAARRRLRRHPHVTVVEADALVWPLPRRPFRVVANLPFHGSTAIMRRLLGDPRVPLTRADVVVALGAARGWTGRPARVDAVSWFPWWDVRLVRRLDRRSFRPPPSVDAAVLVVRRRRRPLLPPREHQAFERFVRRELRASERPAATPEDVVAAYRRRVGSHRRHGTRIAR